MQSNVENPVDRKPPEVPKGYIAALKRLQVCRVNFGLGHGHTSIPNIWSGASLATMLHGTKNPEANMTTVDPAELLDISKAVLAAIQRDGRLPARLDEEDYNDLIQEGVLAALGCMDRFDPQRGSLRAYLAQPICRSQLKEAWRMASVGITGDHEALQVWSASNMSDDEFDAAIDCYTPDIAEEIEAFDHVWHTRYTRT